MHQSGPMTSELYVMLIAYLRDMTSRGDYEAKQLLTLLEETTQ